MHGALVHEGGVFLEDGKTLSNSDGSASTLDQLQHGRCSPLGQEALVLELR
jgi:hypothetical protein